MVSSQFCSASTVVHRVDNLHCVTPSFGSRKQHCHCHSHMEASFANHKRRLRIAFSMTTTQERPVIDFNALKEMFHELKDKFEPKDFQGLGVRKRGERRKGREREKERERRRGRMLAS